jgi:2'-5' RNA ligase
MRTGRIGAQRLIRAFIAVEIPEDIREAIHGVALRLADKVSGVRWVEERNLHLTIKFLGEVQWDMVGKIGETMKREAAKVEEFDLSFQAVSAFPPGRSPRVIAVGVHGESQMAEIHRALDRCMIEFGASREDRAFLPHLTVGRIKARGQPDLAECLAPLAEKEFGNFLVEKLTLFQSELSPQGPTYTCLCTAEMASGGSIPGAGGKSQQGEGDADG